MAFVNPHLTFPLQYDGAGDLVEHEQNGADDVINAVNLAASVVAGQLEFHPEFGVPDIAMIKDARGGLRASILQPALQRWEDRAPIACLDAAQGADVLVEVAIDTARLVDDTQRRKAGDL